MADKDGGLASITRLTTQESNSNQNLKNPGNSTATMINFDDSQRAIGERPVRDDSFMMPLQAIRNAVEENGSVASKDPGRMVCEPSSNGRNVRGSKRAAMGAKRLTVAAGCSSGGSGETPSGYVRGDAKVLTVGYPGDWGRGPDGGTALSVQDPRRTATLSVVTDAEGVDGAAGGLAVAALLGVRRAELGGYR